MALAVLQRRAGIGAGMIVGHLSRLSWIAQIHYSQAGRDKIEEAQCGVVEVTVDIVVVRCLITELAFLPDARITAMILHLESELPDPDRSVLIANVPDARE